MAITGASAGFGGGGGGAPAMRTGMVATVVGSFEGIRTVACRTSTVPPSVRRFCT